MTQLCKSLSIGDKNLRNLVQFIYITVQHTFIVCPKILECLLLHCMISIVEVLKNIWVSQQCWLPFTSPLDNSLLQHTLWNDPINTKINWTYIWWSRKPWNESTLPYPISENTAEFTWYKCALVPLDMNQLHCLMLWNKVKQN